MPWGVDNIFVTIFNCQGYDKLGNKDTGVLGADSGISGDFAGCTIIAIVGAFSGISGIAIIGTIIESTESIIGADSGISGECIIGELGYPWIWTAKIGSLDFTEDLDGEVVKRPLPWSGWVYQIKKLGDTVIVYGQNGISQLKSIGVAWGEKTILPIGLIGKCAICVDDEYEPKNHYCIDKEGQLWHLSLGSGLKLLDYKEYLSALNSNTVMSYDTKNNIIYIADGSIGFVYSASGLGKGPNNITGIGYRGGTSYIVAPAAIVTSPFQICTDILDFGSRTEKMIDEVECGTDVVNDLYAAVDYRWKKYDSFITSPWIKTNFEGVAFLMTSGIEFRIRVKLLTYEFFELDYLKIRGKYADTKPIALGVMYDSKVTA